MRLLSDLCIGACQGKRGYRRALLAVLLLAGAVTISQGAVSSPVQAAQTSNLALVVEDVDSAARPSTASSTSSTSTTPARPTADAHRSTSAIPRLPATRNRAPGHRWASRAQPDLTQGDQDDFPLLDLPDGRYLISVLADGYKLDGAHFTMPMDDCRSRQVLLQAPPMPSRCHDPGRGLRRHRARQRCTRPACRARPRRMSAAASQTPSARSDRCVRQSVVHALPGGDTENPVVGSGGNCFSYCYVVDTGVDIGIRPRRPAPTTRPLPHDLRPARPRRPDGPATCYTDRRAARIGRRQQLQPAGPVDGGHRGQGQDPEPRHEPLHARSSHRPTDPTSSRRRPSRATTTGTHGSWKARPASTPSSSSPANRSRRSSSATPPGQPRHDSSRHAARSRGVVDAVKVYVPATGGLSQRRPDLGRHDRRQDRQADRSVRGSRSAISANGDTAVWVGRGDANGHFTIPDVPDGNYMLTWWDEPQDYILDWQNVTVDQR